MRALSFRAMSTQQPEDHSDNQACSHRGMADATCHVVLTPEFARALRVSETRFVKNGLCDGCWHELFGRTADWERFVRRWVRIGPQEMDQARTMIERKEWR